MNRHKNMNKITKEAYEEMEYLDDYEEQEAYDDIDEETLRRGC